jgi:hypothetical protein
MEQPLSRSLTCTIMGDKHPSLNLICFIPAITLFLFWLAKLNLFGGDFRRAEMVKAFISSTEYRRRFGTP